MDNSRAPSGLYGLPVLFANDATPYMLVFGSILVAGIIGVWLRASS